MNKEEQIKYLNKIKPFLNLKAICDDYNKKNNNAIDYNNLRAVLNGVSKTRLSAEKLDAFIEYLYQYLFVEVFEIDTISLSKKSTRLSNIVDDYAKKISEEIAKELNNEL